jgi:hypothetical protein
MWDDRWIDDNHAALQRYCLFGKAEKAALDAVAKVARLVGPSWLPEEYRWLEQRWRA